LGNKSSKGNGSTSSCCLKRYTDIENIKNHIKKTMKKERKSKKQTFAWKDSRTNLPMPKRFSHELRDFCPQKLNKLYQPNP